MKKIKRNLLLGVSTFLLVGGMFIITPHISEASNATKKHHQCKCNKKCKGPGSCCLKSNPVNEL